MDTAMTVTDTSVDITLDEPEAVAEAAEAEVEVHAPTREEQVTELLDDVKARILHLLDIYPYLPKTLIQTGLSPAMAPKLWKPILDELVASGDVLIEHFSTTTPGGRSLNKEVYHLPKYPYPPAAAVQATGNPNLIEFTIPKA